MLDDVSTSGVSDLLEQDKSAFSRNPVGDRATDLWKCLAAWLDLIRNGALKESARFVLYTAQPHKGSVIGRIHAASDSVLGQSLAVALRKEFWGDGPLYEARSRLPEDLAGFVNHVLSANDETLGHLFASITFETGSGHPDDDLKAALRHKAISEPAVDGVLSQMLGWTKRELARRHENGEPATISWRRFRTALVAAVRKHDRRDAFLPPTSQTPSASTIEQHLQDSVYVRQLEAIECKTEQLREAVSDYLLAAVSRTEWSDKGDVAADSFDDYGKDLERGWLNKRTQLSITDGHRSERDQGHLLCAACMELRPHLQGLITPTYFVSGSLHLLADSLLIGWHPRYRDFHESWLKLRLTTVQESGSAATEPEGET